MKLWGGRFTKATDTSVDEFTASISFDQQLAEVDILGSLTHVKMLGKCGVLSQDEVTKISQGLESLATKFAKGEVDFKVSDEDIHMNVERLLHEKIGTVAGKLHTGRSRNDQVALDLHLYLREQVILVIRKLLALQQALFTQAQENIDTILPGYTHLQRAQPVRFAHHLLAYVAMLQRDIERLQNSLPRINTMPLGAGAIAGSGFAIDRQQVADDLHFERLYENSMDAISDRDFVVEFLSHASLIMMHLSRLSEELILWSSREFSFIELDDAYCTGSSMMPQKKNPDVAELVRGKTGRVYGALIGMLTTLKGLPLTYNKDMQEDKEGLFDTVATLTGSLTLFAPMIATMQVRKKTMENAAKNDFSNATELADYLAKKGLPFRDAHEVIGQIVRHCIENNLLLMDLPLTQYQKFSKLFEPDLYACLELENVVNARSVRGGTAKTAVEQQLMIVEKQIKETVHWLENK